MPYLSSHRNHSEISEETTRERRAELTNTASDHQRWPWPMDDSKKLNKGHTTPLKNRGLISSKTHADIPVSFNAVRTDSLKRISANPFKGAENDFIQDHLRLLNTFKGDSISSESDNGFPVGTHWGKNKLSPSVNVIEVHNGTDGALGAQIPLSNINTGSPVIVTTGSLNGCVTVFAIKDDDFYAYHAGTSSAKKGGWKTAVDGVVSIFDAHDLLTSNASDRPTGDYSYNDLVSLFAQEYDQSLITYLGKGSAIITSSEANVGTFNYGEIPKDTFDIRAGHSHALLARTSKAISVKAYSEDNEMKERGGINKTLASQKMTFKKP